MKVLLIQPPIEDFYDTAIRTYPLSLIMVATKIRDICDPVIVDCRSKGKRMLPENPFPELDRLYRRDTYSPFSLFRSYYRFGLYEKDIADIIRTHKPNVVAISSLFTTYAAQALQVAAIAKGVDSSITTVMGGTHPTVYPEHCLSSPHVDFAIRGEGETPFYRLIEALKAGADARSGKIEGLAFHRDGKLHIPAIAVEEKIDLIPDRMLVDKNHYRIGKKPYSFFLTSRGCPFQCSFCGKPPAPYRRRGLAHIEKEVGQCVDLGIGAIDFEDDMLNLDIPSFHSLLDCFHGTCLQLSAMNGLYAGTLGPATLERMFDAGFRRLNLSLVDASPSINRAQKRQLPAHMSNLLSYLEGSSFLTETHFIIGLPGQQPRDVIDTMVYLMGKRLLPGPSIYYPVPGSPLFESSKPSASPDSFKDMRSSALNPVNPEFPRETLFTFAKLSRFINTVKAAVDNNPSMGHLLDILDIGFPESRPHDRHIMEELLLRKKFTAWVEGLDGYIEEVQDHALVTDFFDAIRGKPIKGFKTSGAVLADT